MQIKSVYILISGHVQGVGFRYFVQHKAQELQICGWVKNTPEGEVEIEASGDHENLRTFIDQVKIGPARATIKTFSASDITPSRTFINFTIR